MSEAFHKRLRRLRETKNFSATEMAKLIGVPKTTYSDWENGKGLKLLPYQTICQTLAVSVTELIVGETPKQIDHLNELRLLEAKLREIRLKLLSVS